jgi:hypothetical protein
MFNHLLQIASFKSGPQHFKSNIAVPILIAILFIAIEAVLLDLTPGNELHLMAIQSTLKVIVIWVFMYTWLKSCDVRDGLNSTITAMLFVALIAEIIRLPLWDMIRGTKESAQVVLALGLSIIAVGVVAWQYSVWYYILKQMTQRSMGEIIAVLISIVVISEVVGSVAIQIGAPIGGLS